MTNAQPALEDHEALKERMLAQLRHDAELVPSFAPEPTGDPQEDAEMMFTAEELENDILVRGLFYAASVVVVDELFQDLVTSYEEGFDSEDTHQLWLLPEAYASQYETLFIKSFIAATIDASRRVVDGDGARASIAEELGLRLILDQMEATAHLLDITLLSGWRLSFEGAYFDELDYDMLCRIDRAGVDVKYWFVPFTDEIKTSPAARLDRG